MSRCLNPRCHIPGGEPIADEFILCSDCFRVERRRHHPGWGGQNERYPFPEMKVGETRVIDRPRANVAPAATQYGRRHGMRFSTCLDDDRPDTHCTLTRIA